MHAADPEAGLATPIALDDFIRLCRFPIGRACFALRHAVAAAEELGEEVVGEAARRALDAARAALDLLLRRLEPGGDLEARMELLDMGPYVPRPRELHDACFLELDRAVTRKGPTFDELRAATARGQQRLLEVVATIVGREVGSDEG